MPSILVYILNLICVGIKFFNCLPIEVRSLPKSKFGIVLKNWLLLNPLYSIEEFFEVIRAEPIILGKVAPVTGPGLKMIMHDKPQRNKITEKPISRVTALDSVDLDSEIQRILKEQLLKIVHILSPPWARWEPELDLFLRLVVWKLSVHHAGATFGQQLLSIKYNSGLTRRKSIAWATLAIGVGYLHKRSSELTAVIAPEQREQVRKWLDRVEAGVLIARMLNLLMFLREGHFPDLVDRLVGVKPVAATSASRIVGYSYMTRELLWHGFVELIVFLLPLVNFSLLRRSLRNFSGLGRTKGTQRETLVYTTATRCPVCHQPPTLPHQMGCGHAFCYYCLQSSRAADVKFECPTCGHSAEDSLSVQPVTSSQCRSL